MASFGFLDEKDAESWHYRGEGAANVVLAYHGLDPSLNGKVLRIQKVVEDAMKGSSPTPVLTPEEQLLWEEWPDMVAATSAAELNHAYIRNVLRPLLGATHVDPGIIVSVSGLFVEAVIRNIANSRPAWRVDTGALPKSSLGLLIADHSSFTIERGILLCANNSPTITVEIKPKCGFLPNYYGTKSEIKKTVSRFTMHQILKLSTGKIKRVSSYCPLDLFSGTEDGIQKALVDLFASPQNNLRIFCNGEEVFGDFDGSTVDPKVASGPLENELKQIFTSPDEVLTIFQNLIAHLLHESKILEKLLYVQKLDSVDIEILIDIYNTFLRILKESGRATCEADLIHDLVKTSNKPMEDCRRQLRDFLIAATGKDCGIMVALQPVKAQVQYNGSVYGGNTTRFAGQDFVHKIHFLDLDVKRMRKIPFYFQLDQTILRSYMSYLSRQDQPERSTEIQT